MIKSKGIPCKILLMIYLVNAGLLQEIKSVLKGAFYEKAPFPTDSYENDLRDEIPLTNVIEHGDTGELDVLQTWANSINIRILPHPNNVDLIVEELIDLGNGIPSFNRISLCGLQLDQTIEFRITQVEPVFPGGIIIGRNLIAKPILDIRIWE
jgi:hypothetical protein